MLTAFICQKEYLASSLRIQAAIKSRLRENLLELFSTCHAKMSSHKNLGTREKGRSGSRAALGYGRTTSSEKEWIQVIVLLPNVHRKRTAWKFEH